MAIFFFRLPSSLHRKVLKAFVKAAFEAKSERNEKDEKEFIWVAPRRNPQIVLEPEPIALLEANIIHLSPPPFGTEFC